MPKMATSGFIITIALIGVFVLGIIILTWWVKRDKSVKHKPLRDFLAPDETLEFPSLLAFTDTVGKYENYATPITLKWVITSPDTLQVLINSEYVGTLALPDPDDYSLDEYAPVTLAIINEAPVIKVLRSDKTEQTPQTVAQVFVRPEIRSSIARELYKSQRFIEILANTPSEPAE